MLIFLSACAGHNRILFLTKTNVGLDVSQAPLPTAEVTIARREVAILPTYQDTVSERYYFVKNEDNPTDDNNPNSVKKDKLIREDTDKTLPLLGSFALTGGFFNPHISSVFAGGAPAVYLATDGAVDEHGNYHSIWLSQAPDTRSALQRFWDNLRSISSDKAIQKEITDKQKQVKPFYFATDTAFGVKVAWDGTGGPYPTNLKIGYNRTEFAYPPILVSKIPEKELESIGLCNRNKSSNDDAAQNHYEKKDECDRWEVKVPSFFASLENSVNLSKSLTDSESGVSQVQVFATGEAAKAWAKRESIKKATFKLMAPTAAEFENSDSQKNPK